MRRRLVVTLISCVLGLTAIAGCQPDNDVYIQNNTDQKLYFVIIGDDGSWNQKASLYPRTTTTVSALDSGCASVHFLIADADRNVIKRLDQVCWHGLYSVP